jgi:hypothetical protein
VNKSDRRKELLLTDFGEAKFASEIPYWEKERLLGAGGRTTSDMKPFQAVTRLATTSSSAEIGKVAYQKTHLDDAITSIVAPGKLND